MQMLETPAFLEWSLKRGIGFDPRYPDSHELCFLPPEDFSRFWTYPSGPETWPYFIDAILSGLDDWSTGVLWPRTGIWPSSKNSTFRHQKVRDIILRGAGVGDGVSGAILFERAEEDVLLTILYAYRALDFFFDDLFFVPDHGWQIIQASHHDVFHVEFSDDERMGEFIQHMKTKGYELPKVPPDWTFIWPSWMTQAEEDSVENIDSSEDIG